ncbi:MAG: uncharacterized protein JWO38_5449 [Gemmataceae bacterium]|nr:uncharacterized protein [Gemmataceae bacterium]
MHSDTLDDPFLDEIEDVATCDEYERHGHYLERCRRIRLGPAVVVFENRRTLRFRVQELARVARYAGRDRVRRELAWYKSLLPGRHHLLASVTVRARGVSPTGLDGQAHLRAGDHLIPGVFLAKTGGDRIIGKTRWALFRFSAADLAAAADHTRPLVLGFDSPGYQYESMPLDPAVRNSLLADLGPPDEN